MSLFKVPLTKIINITPHFNAEKLEVATVYGFQVVIQKDKYKVGDSVLYVPIDSVLPPSLESKLFPEGSKIKLHKSRVKQIRIRNFPSQGMLINLDEVKDLINISNINEEDDVSEKLGIVKYEPPAPSFSVSVKTSRNKPLENPLFHKFNGLENIKWFPNLFEEGEIVVIQEKLHGSNARCSYLPTVVPSIKEILSALKLLKTRPNERKSILLSCLNMFLRSIKNTLGLLPKYEFCYGSNNVELTNRVGYTGFYGEDVYGAVFKKVKANEKIKPNETIFGELIGHGIQKNYDYGFKNEHHFVLFDVKILNEDGSTRWLNPLEVQEYAKERGFDIVPTLYSGPFNKEQAYELTKGDSVYCPSQKIREGIVIKSVVDYNNPSCPNSRKSLKWISEAYLDKDNTDFH
jgi:RNA ligase (TIGR02306 family)